MAKNRPAREQKTPVLCLVPLLFAIAVVPLIVRVHAYDPGLEDRDFFSALVNENRTIWDVFLYYKMVWFVVAASFMAVVVLYRLITEGRKIRFSKIFIPLGVYAFLALLSSIVSEHQPYPFTGIYEQFEPVWVLLGYCMIAYYAYLYVNSARDLKILLIGFSVATVLMLLIGMSQAFFTDFNATTLGAFLMMPYEQFKLWKINPSGLSFNFEAGRVYLTVYNPNYVGSYVSLISPLFLMLIFAVEKLWMKIGCGIIYMGLLLCLLGSLSRAGFVGIIASLLMIAVIFNKQLIKYWFPTLLIIIILVGTIYTYDNYKDGTLRNKIKSAFKSPETLYNLTQMETLDDEVLLTYKGNNFHVRFNFDYSNETYSMSLYDDNYSEIPHVYDEEIRAYRVTDERFEGFTVGPELLRARSETEEALVGFEVVIDNYSWYFANIDGSYYVRTIYGKMVKQQTSESFEALARKGGFASGRGFIWSKTIPLLKHNILLGSGADTFILEFPNDDYLAMKNGGYGDQMMTKPHNQYLQMAVQTGCLSVLAFIVFYAWYFISSLKSWFTLKHRSLATYTGAGILCGTFGYMVVQIINDSTVSVAPIYWGLIGIGMAAFRIAGKEEANG